MIPLAIVAVFLIGVYIGASNMRSYTIKEMRARERSNWAELAKVMVKDHDRALTLVRLMAKSDGEES